MALTGSQKAYLQARSGIARSAAIRSNYVFPLYGVISVGGLDITQYIQYGSLRVTQQLNEQPDQAAFEVMLTDSAVQAALVVGADVLIGLGAAQQNAVFGGRVLTAQTRRGPARTPSVRSVMCADYLQVFDSEYLITYNWPAQSATTTIQDLIIRFANKPGGVAISPAGVAVDLPSHAAFAVANERLSTVLRRLVTMFPTGGGFYIDALKVLHVWAGVSEPNVGNPQPLTLDNPTLKAFAETVDGSQQRDAVLVEGRRTTAPIGTPATPGTPAYGDAYSIPVLDASILDPFKEEAGLLREVRIGTQRLLVRVVDGIWSAPAGTPQTTTVAADVPFDPAGGGGNVQITLATSALLTGRSIPWIRIDEQYLQVLGYSEVPFPYAYVPRTGYGALIGPIKAGASVIVVDNLAGMYLTQRYNAPGSPEQVRAQPIDAEVVMTVRSATGDAVHEHLVQDGRFSRTGATERGLREVLDFSAPLTSIDFETDDLNAAPGRLQAYNLVEPPLAAMVGEYMIISAELTWPVWGQPPRRQCQAAVVRAANVVDAWLVDPR